MGGQQIAKWGVPCPFQISTGLLTYSTTRCQCRTHQLP